jgi:hypothetical protein
MVKIIPNVRFTKNISIWDESTNFVISLDLFSAKKIQSTLVLSYSIFVIFAIETINKYTSG